EALPVSGDTCRPGEAAPPATGRRDEALAYADGLTADDAYALAVWLKEHSYADIEVIAVDAQRYTVRWRRWGNDPTRTHHRDHRARRLVPRGTVAGEGLRGPRGHPAVVVLQHQPDRSPLPGPAHSQHPVAAHLRRPQRRQLAEQDPSHRRAR